MDIAEVVRELRVFALWPRAFSLDELLDFVGPTSGHERLRSALHTDSRFVRLSSAPPDEDRFILDAILFRWFSSLNVRLARARQYRLDERQLVVIMSALRLDGQWQIPPPEAIRWGRSLGLIRTAYAQDHYVFPLAQILSCLRGLLLRVAMRLLDDFAEKQVWRLPLRGMVEECVDEGFSHFDPRTVEIVRGRVGLLTGTEMTLEQAGSAYGLTRERTRQLEEKFWGKLKAGGPVGRRRGEPFITALLCDFMDESGSLVVRDDSPKRRVRAFLARCAGIPQVPLSEIAVTVLGGSPEDLSGLESRGWLPYEIDADVIAGHLESLGQVSLMNADVRVLAEGAARIRRKRLTAARRVYLALRTIGRPAHYSRITEVHNSLFPERAAGEHNVLNMLSQERHGVVWVGVRGTYALREWGYERPSATLFDRVRGIVERIYDATGRPVPFAVIAAEMGKYRRVVNPASLRIAGYCNKNLLRVGQDCFVPRGPEDRVEDEISSEELDRILREFEEGR